ncbi:hypothetical protein P0W64_21120 [Tsukamurella sp. 8F]|uniref:hypothetical protein n=1 Tax=unclassified Tsukamurella TaxID=2633480 RepID=UPI0023B8AB5A|nr:MULTISPECIES: hypothetical protein [unclassified Tsukamurella]MDF0532259.1 hypothetical protein [Tsukamurella sp. 8J]MDF0589285.1 hypothetical protein [Tsukamurella sp. 8F]
MYRFYDYGIAIDNEPTYSGHLIADPDTDVLAAAITDYAEHPGVTVHWTSGRDHLAFGITTEGHQALLLVMPAEDADLGRLLDT